MLQSLSMMLLHGEGGAKDIELSVLHLCIGASFGHLRSMNSLAHALLDHYSWLATYARDIAARKYSGAADLRKNASSYRKTNNANESEAFRKPKKRPGISYHWLYDENTTNEAPLRVILPHTVVELPSPIAPSCEAALPLLKHIANSMYRTNEVTRLALSSYLDGAVWLALDHYDEAADLGVPFAQYNAATMYEELESKECGEGLPGLGESDKKSAFYLQSSLDSSAGDQSDPSNSSELENATNYLSSYGVPLLSGSLCSKYMQRLATRRWLQLAKAGDDRAIREIADRVLAGSYPLQKNDTYALELYVLCAEFGDAQCLVSLGWILLFGSSG